RTGSCTRITHPCEGQDVCTGTGLIRKFDAPAGGPDPASRRGRGVPEPGPDSVPPRHSDGRAAQRPGYAFWIRRTGSTLRVTVSAGSSLAKAEPSSPTAVQRTV